MKILIITSSYPSTLGAGGGYSQLCEEVVEGLYSKGHQIAVFTSTAYSTTTTRAYPVWRKFKLEPDWGSSFPAYLQFYFGRVQRNHQVLISLKKSIESFDPDIVFIWHVVGIDREIFRWLENSSGLPIAYYLADYAVETPDEYYAYWREPAEKNFKSLPKNFIAKRAITTLAKENKPIHLKYANAMCVSNFVRERLISKHVIPDTSVVIHNGVDLKIFDANDKKYDFDKLDCLVLGRLVPEKGISTVIKSFSLLAGSDDIARLKLTILGDGPEDYVSALRNMINSSDLQKAITIGSSVNRSQIPGILREHNTLIFASEWDEPLARSVQEAMAMRLLVIGTVTGGTGEVLIPYKTGLVFKTRDASDLAGQLLFSLSNPLRVMELAEGGYDLVHKSFNIISTVYQIESYLNDLSSRSAFTSAALTDQTF